MTSKRTPIILGSSFVLLLVLLIGLSHWIMFQTDKIVPDRITHESLPEIQSPPPPPPVIEAPKAILENSEFALFRKIRKEPNRAFDLSILYKDGVEVARFKSNTPRNFYDLNGNIPDGTYVFRDETHRSYGEEQFENNMRTGTYKEFYENGKLHYEITFESGEVLTYLEYYIDGQLRMNADYADTLMMSDDIENGRGKIYYRDGTLMYEWQMTSQSDQRYKKSYNIKGELIETKLFNENGDLLKTIDHTASP